MAKKEIHYFINTIGSQGQYSFYDSNFSGLKQIIPLSCYPERVVRQLVETVSEQAAKKGYRTEILHDFLTNGMEGIIIPEAETGLINYPGYREQDYNLLHILDDTNTSDAKKQLKEAQQHFSDALKTHDDWEKIYIENMDFSTLNDLTEATIERVVGNNRAGQAGRGYDRFLGAATADGSVDYIENITDTLSKRYFIKGRPGTGKSTFMRKIAEKAIANGYVVEIYHCSFDPNSLDMIVIRDLDVCLFDSTAPHEYFPSRSTDEIIDIYETAVKAGTDEKYAAELFTVSTDYKFKVMAARKCLAKARDSFEKTEAYHSAKIDRNKLSQIQNNILSLLLP